MEDGECDGKESPRSKDCRIQELRNPPWSPSHLMRSDNQGFDQSPFFSFPERKRRQAPSISGAPGNFDAPAPRLQNLCGLPPLSFWTREYNTRRWDGRALACRDAVYGCPRDAASANSIGMLTSFYGCSL